MEPDLFFVNCFVYQREPTCPLYYLIKQNLVPIRGFTGHYKKNLFLCHAQSLNLYYFCGTFIPKSSKCHVFSFKKNSQPVLTLFFHEIAWQKGRFLHICPTHHKIIYYPSISLRFLRLVSYEVGTRTTG